MARLSVAVLGAPDVRRDGQPLVFPTRKALAILLYALTEGGPQPRDKLTALLWPESDGAAARATLRSTVARLREALDGAADQHLLVDRATIAVRRSAEMTFDLDALERAYALARALTAETRPLGDERLTAVECLRRGADAWRGEFLEGFSLPDAPDFDDWAGLQREVWRRRMEVVLDRLSRLYADGGDSERAAETVGRWLALSPLEERAYRRLMRLRFAAGDRAAALAVYERGVQALDRDLGVAPDPRTAALAERIRRAHVATSDATRLRSHMATSAPRETPLVGREDEFSQLVERFHVASQGQIQGVVLQGEAGIGKTRLASEFLAWAEAQGAEVLQGRAFETSARLPYQPLIDALRPRLEREPEPAELLNAVWLTELSRLLPELRERLPDLPLPNDDEATRTHLYEALARLGCALAARAPLVVFVDDLQWADEASLDVLRYAARRWRRDGSAVLLLFCLRSEALAAMPSLEAWLLDLYREAEPGQIDLGPLDFDETRRLVQAFDPRRTSGDSGDAFTRWIFAETGGQPFYVVEALRSLGDGGEAPAGLLLPPNVRRIIHARLAPLSQAARNLVHAAAILGQNFTFDLLCHVGGLAEDEALPALDAALRAHVLRECVAAGDVAAGAYVFAHDKVREVSYQDAGEARRRVFHRRAMNVLEGRGAPSAELARHALGAGLDESALRFSTAAGDDAAHVLAARDAAAHYETAIGLAQRLERHELLAELHARRGRAFVVMGEWTDARRELESALSGLASDRTDRYAEVLTDVAEASWWELDVPAVYRHAAEARALASRLGRADLETKAVAWQGAAEGAMGDLARCGDLIEHAIVRAHEAGIAAPAIAGHYRPLTLYWLGQPVKAVAAARDAVAVAQARNDVSWLITAYPNLGLALAAIGQYGEATRTFAEARRIGREHGLDSLLARAMAISTGFHFEVFDFAGAEALAQEARHQARAAGFLPAAVSAGIDLLFTYARQGEIGKTDGLVDEVAAAIEEAGGFHRWQWAMRLAAARAEIANGRGDREQALFWAEETIAQSRARGRPKYEVIGLTTRAECQNALGRSLEAIADLKTAVALARKVGDPALLLRPAAALLRLDGDNALSEQGQAAVARIASALPDDDMRRRFEIAEPVRAIVGDRSDLARPGAAARLLLEPAGLTSPSALPPRPRPRGRALPRAG